MDGLALDRIPIIRAKGRRVLTLPITTLAGVVLDLMREPALIAHREILVKGALPMEFEIESIELDPEAGKVRLTLLSPAWPAGEMDGTPVSPILAIRTEPAPPGQRMRS